MRISDTQSENNKYSRGQQTGGEIGRRYIRRGNRPGARAEAGRTARRKDEREEEEGEGERGRGRGGGERNWERRRFHREANIAFLK